LKGITCLKTNQLVQRARVARFVLVQYTKTGKIYQITTKLPNGHKIIKWPQNYQMATKLPNGHNIYLQHVPLQGLPKYTRIDIFGIKYVYHLATLHRATVLESFPFECLGNRVCQHSNIWSDVKHRNLNSRSLTVKNRGKIAQGMSAHFTPYVN
jgi:hypothetical protein